jgi:hypothetical protein
MATKKTHWDDLEIDPVIILCAVETYAILKGIGCGTPLRSDSDYMASIGGRPSILYLKYDQENLTSPSASVWGGGSKLRAQLYQENALRIGGSGSGRSASLVAKRTTKKKISVYQIP